MKLNIQQKSAAEFARGVAIVVAVPGAGKTLTMTHRIANLVKTHSIDPESILGLTFTRNAAHAMRDKLKPVLEDVAQRVTLSTIHSFCHSLLRNEGRVFEVVSGREQVKLIKQIMKQLKVKNLPSGMILQELNLAKNNLILPPEFKELYATDKTMQKIVLVYEAYEQEKKRRMLLDFNDLLTESYLLLKNKKQVRERCQEAWQHILVDEFQDTNPAQMEILKLLTEHVNGNGSSFWVCGDDWQSIYGFTGATVGNILNFQKMYPGSKQFILDTNYRSTPQILSYCQNLIDHNTKKIHKVLSTSNAEGEDVTILTGSDEEDEALQITQEVQQLIESGSYRHKDIAVLYRNNAQSRVIEEVFSQNQLPYHIENGTNFYQRPEISVLLDYLRVINDPKSEEADDALRNVINIPNRYIGRKFMAELEQHAEHNSKHLYEALCSMQIDVPYVRKNVKELIKFLNPLMKDTADRSPSELIEILREGLEYDSFIAEDDIPAPDDSKIANINQLQLAASRYKDVRSFLNHTETFREEIACNKNGVKLMTIHKAKGLEFPVVFLIGMIDGILPNKQGDIDEERRIAFVGLSRAMKLLYLTYSHTSLSRQAKRSPFIEEMLKTAEGEPQFNL